MKLRWLKTTLLVPYWIVIGTLWLWSLGVYYYAVNMPLLLKWCVVVLWLLAAFLLLAPGRETTPGILAPTTLPAVPADPLVLNPPRPHR